MKNIAIQVRRKPTQSRAKMTQEALQESFVRLLHERAAVKITIREITDLAGVGLGTFYEYFSKKEDLIALTIHLHVKQNAEKVKKYALDLIKTNKNLALSAYIKQVIYYQLDQIQQQQFLWAQCFVLERQISSVESYQKSYAMMLGMWKDVLVPCIDDIEHLQSLSLNLQRLCYGFVSQMLLNEPNFQKWDALKKDIMLSIDGHL